MYTTPINSLTYGLQLLLKPLKKINSNKIALSISFSLKFIPIVLEQATNTIQSLKARGIDYNKETLKNKLEILKLIIIPIFVNSIKKSDNISDILELRLYDVNKMRTNYRINEWNLKDTIFITLNVIILLIVRLFNDFFLWWNKL